MGRLLGPLGCAGDRLGLPKKLAEFVELHTVEAYEDELGRSLVVGRPEEGLRIAARARVS
jgi:hypothetical protein